MAESHEDVEIEVMAELNQLKERNDQPIATSRMVVGCCQLEPARMKGSIPSLQHEDQKVPMIILQRMICGSPNTIT